MNKITAVIAAVALAASSTVALAGGPIEVLEEAEPMVIVTNEPASSMGSMGAGAAVLGLLLVAAAVSGGSSNGTNGANGGGQ